MRLTRLHVLLGIIILALISLYVLEYSRKRPAPEPPSVGVSTAPYSVEVSTVNKTEQVARLAIAVAGEYWKKARQEKKDLSTGQANLKRAKVEYAAGNYDEAIRLARVSINNFKSSGMLAEELRYTVKRGETLWAIAKMKQHFGRGSMWYRIWRRNEKLIPDFDVIYRGQVLVIPQG